MAIHSTAYSVGNFSFSGQFGYDLGRWKTISDQLRGLDDVDAGGVSRRYRGLRDGAGGTPTACLSRNHRRQRGTGG